MCEVTGGSPETCAARSSGWRCTTTSSPGCLSWSLCNSWPLRRAHQLNFRQRPYPLLPLGYVPPYTYSCGVYILPFLCEDIVTYCFENVMSCLGQLANGPKQLHPSERQATLKCRRVTKRFSHSVYTKMSHNVTKTLSAPRPHQRWAHVCPKSELRVPGAMKGINAQMEDCLTVSL